MVDGYKGSAVVALIALMSAVKLTWMSRSGLVVVVSALTSAVNSISFSSCAAAVRLVGSADAASKRWTEIWGADVSETASTEAVNN